MTKEVEKLSDSPGPTPLVRTLPPRPGTAQESPRNHSSMIHRKRAKRACLRTKKEEGVRKPEVKTGKEARNETKQSRAESGENVRVIAKQRDEKTETKQMADSGDQDKSRLQNSSAGKQRANLKSPKQNDHVSASRRNTRSASRKSREQNLQKARNMSSSGMEDMEEPAPEVTMLGQLVRFLTESSPPCQQRTTWTKDDEN